MSNDDNETTAELENELIAAAQELADHGYSLEDLVGILEGTITA